MRFEQSNRFLNGYIIIGISLCLLAFSPAIERLAISDSKLIDPIWQEHDPEAITVVDHGSWDAFLIKYVKTDDRGINRVAYADVSAADKMALRAYLAQLQSIDPAAYRRDEQLAYWVNLYNAQTVSVVLDHYPVASIRKIKFKRFSNGPWGEPLMMVKGRELSLDDIESGIVRPIWNDPLIHYGFNCAALSCPNLGREAYEGAQINTQLKVAAVAYVNDVRGVRTNDKGGLVLSKIYGWYLEDFGGAEQTILDHVRGYAQPALLARLDGREEIDDYEYDWDLNDVATGVFTETVTTPSAD